MVLQEVCCHLKQYSAENNLPIAQDCNSFKYYFRVGGK